MVKKSKILLGMSGGVDSSVAAVLLLEQGYEVIGAFMKNWSDGDDSAECSWRTERRDAQRVAAKLGIDFYTFDFETEYRKNVYEYMLREYEAGRTPNPDVLCNKYMKFGYLLREAEKLGCNFIATGHYARIKRDDDGTAHLLSGLDKNKDQSYFLCQLSQEQLKKAMFPIGDFQKDEIRKIAKDHNLHLADKKDSQGICFVGKVEMIDFLRDRIPEKKGDIITTSGEVIGQHRGHQYYTIGQRSGLGIGGGTPYYIVERRPETNEIVVALGDDDPALYKKIISAEQISEIIPGTLNNFVGQPLKARIRYRQPLQGCKIMKINNGIVLIEFDQPQRAVAPGQFIAFYDDDELIGSAVIQ